MSSALDFETLVIGAGPAGIAAAVSAAGGGRSVALVDDNPDIGGQIWRNSAKHPVSSQAARWCERLERSSVVRLSGWQIVDHPQQFRLTAQAEGNSRHLTYRQLILATGARERFLPFPGWTLPNVMGAGGLQAMVKSGLDVQNKRVVIAGTGPLLPAVGALLRRSGAKVLLIAEQASRASLVRFGLTLATSPSKVWQAAGIFANLLGVPYHTGCWPVRAEGKGRVESVEIQTPRGIQHYEVDYLACGFHLVPNNELAALLGCRLQNGFVAVNEWQQTSLENVYCAGEPTGIAGVESALVEGQIAGYAAAGDAPRARALFAERDRYRRFAQALERATELRAELRHLADNATIVCRCEDVPLGSLKDFNSFREAKMQTRCGMGPCQGRVCGAALQSLFDWQDTSVRPPIFPATVESWTMQADA